MIGQSFGRFVVQGQARIGRRQQAGVPFFFKQWGEFIEQGHHEEGPTIMQVQTGSPQAKARTAATRRPLWIAYDGTTYDAPEKAPPRVAVRLLDRVGKEAAGAMLDGREWREMPRPAPESAP